jgi:DNA invertase Pin-like site-specific DNA recombinase
MTTAYSYVRFSSEKQSLGDSLRRQLELSENYAKEHNLILDDSLQLTDLGISAFKSDNATTGKLGQFIEAVELGRV